MIPTLPASAVTSVAVLDLVEADLPAVLAFILLAVGGFNGRAGAAAAAAAATAGSDNSI